MSTSSVELPKDLQAVADGLVTSYWNGSKSFDGLIDIQNWLEVDGWDALISDLDQGMAINLGYLSELQFQDRELRSCMEIPNHQTLTDEDRIRWGRSHIDRVLAEYDEYLLPSVHAYELRGLDGLKVVIGCIVETHGQGGPVCQWQGVWPTRESFLEALGKNYQYWVTPLMGDVPDEVILSLWQKPKFSKKQTAKGTKDA
jgi:hypothetical protein